MKCLLTFAGMKFWFAVFCMQTRPVMAQNILGEPPGIHAFHPKINLFSLSDVQLLDGQFSRIMDLDHRYLLSLDPDRLASWFRREAGLSPKAPPYPFWESEDVWGKGPLAGHIMGFYLSSMAMMYQATGDPTIISRLNYTLSELKACQEANKDGYLLATINGRHVFQDVVEKNFTTSNPLINDTWEPVYIMNKIMLGLHGVYTRCNLPAAKEMLIKMADWFGDSVLNKLSHEEVQKLLFCEHGSINESYVQVFELTGDKKYLHWANELNDEDMWVPLSENKDILNGWHANTQIPKFTGFENVFHYTGDKNLSNAASFFWTTVTNKHTWSIGGNSTGEHFFAQKEFENKVAKHGGPESCNSVNMLRLTEILYKDFAEPEKIDYYERVLYNHILSNYDPDSGMCVYYTSMRPGHYKVYGTPLNSFWCCTGTGMESPAKFGQMIYAYDSSSLLVNLFMPSVVSWKEKQVSITQKTNFPDEDETKLMVSAPAPIRFSIKVRHPAWLATSEMPVKINGSKYNGAPVKDGYLEIDRIWKEGDEITVGLPAKLTIEPVPGGDEYVSVLYGPIVLAAKIDNHGLVKADFRSERQVVATKEIPLSVSPSFMGRYKDIIKNISRKKTSLLAFTVAGSVISAPVELIPFNRIHFSRYAVYFKYFEQPRLFDQYLAANILADSIRLALLNATVDAVIIGDPASEKKHRIEQVNSSAGGSEGHGWRQAADGGYFMYDLMVMPDQSQSLYLLLAAADKGARDFEVYADGNLLTVVEPSKIMKEDNQELYNLYIPIAKSIVGNKTKLTIKFQAKRKNTAGGIFDVRIIKAIKERAE